ncbi:MAG: WbqC family protein [Cyclobacteriaceae bacterium]|jgi:hypothetical protein|nr:WbqC family protein [Cyclobacteriaceae bacterium]
MIVVESQYFPPLEYFSLLKGHSDILIDTGEYFVKQTYRNRCHILTSNKTLTLTVPLKGVSKKISTKHIKIDYSENWMKNHWKAIESAYGRSPFFEHYDRHIYNIIFGKPVLLLELNKDILTFCLKILSLDANITYSENYIDSQEEGFKDYRSVISPKISHSNRQIHIPSPYIQTFGRNFAENLSILDLVFCCGPESKMHI